MENRETRVIELPYSKKSVTIHTFLLAKELLASLKADDPAKTMMMYLVVDVAGVKENVYDQIMELRVEDYKFVDNELLKIMDSLKEKKTE